MKAPKTLLSGRNLSEKWVILRKSLKERWVGGGEDFLKGGQITLVKVVMLMEMSCVLESFSAS